MHLFCLNDCLPDVNKSKLTDGLTETLKEFSVLLEKGIGIERAIITDKLPSEILYSNNVTLQMVIDGIVDYDMKTFAHAVFYKYPISSYFKDDDEALITGNFVITADKRQFNALNIAIAQKNAGYIFTPRVHEDICKNPLDVIVDNGTITLHANNLYGQKNNTVEIEEIVEAINSKALNTFRKLCKILGDCTYSKQFEKIFKELLPERQESIIDGFEKAKMRKLHSNFYPDTKIISDVTPAKYKSKVYELRIYTPLALRVYFHEVGSKVYLGSIGFKQDKNQNEDIKLAHSILTRLKFTS